MSACASIRAAPGARRGSSTCGRRAKRSDLYHCVEWAGTQSWSNGKVGINGISYYAMNQWTVGALKPPHLAALCIWEGSSDYYRELCRHGGILSDFFNSWHPRQVGSVQHGVGSRGAKSAVTGELVAGPDTLSAAELAEICADSPGEAKRRKLYDDYHAARTADFAADRGAAALGRQLGRHGAAHPRQFRGFFGAPGPNKNGSRCTATPTSRISTATTARRCRSASSAIFSKARIPAGSRQPRVSLNVRHPHEKFVLRAENEWPLARTQWTKYFLQPDGRALRRQPPSAATTLDYDTTGDGLTFRTPPWRQSFEITGPVAAKLWLSSPTTDADLFLSLAPVRSRRKGGHLHRLERSARAGRARLAARLAAQARSGAIAALPALAQRTTRNGRCGPASRSSSTSKSGRPRSWCRPAIGSRSPLAAKTTKWTARDIALAERALSDERRRPVPAHRPRRSAGRHFRHPQHAALCRRTLAVPLVADHSGEVRSRQEFERARGNLMMSRFAAARGGAAWHSRRRRAGIGAAISQAAPSPSSCPTRPAARPTKPPASSRNRFCDKLKQSFIVEDVSGGNTIIGMRESRTRRARRLHAAPAQSADLRERFAVTKRCRSTPSKTLPR